MDRLEIVAELRNLITDYLKDKNLDLVDLIYRQEGRDLVLRVLVDRPEGGISLGECTQLNKDISNILDGNDLLQASYILEVSSPGLDRPLRSKNDFMRCINKTVKVFLNEKINGKIELEGIITKVEDKLLFIETPSGIVEIPLPKVNLAKQIIGTD